LTIGLTREEVLWWGNPRLLLQRGAYQCFLEKGEDWCKEGEYAFRNHISYRSFRSKGDSLSPVGDLPLLLYQHGSWNLRRVYLVDTAGLFNFEKGWRFNRAYMNDRSNWVDGKLRGAFSGPNEPAMTTLDRVMWVSNDPRTIDLDSIQDTDDTVRLVRLVQTAYQRFVVDEVPAVASLWREGETVLCGWNDLYPDDGRRFHPVDQGYPFGGVTQEVDWNGAVFLKPETWRWRVPK